MNPLMNKLGKVIVVMVTLLFLTVNLGMADEKPVSKMEEAHKRCELLAKLAAEVMSTRQAGVAMSKAMGIALAVDDPMLRDINIRMVSDAYESPRYHTPSIQERETQQFADLWYGTCMKVHQDKK